MPLQNRITPDMKLVRENWRGSFMGNRGGRIHDPDTQSLLKRKWASKRWIICVTEFKNRQRNVMGNGYTELFFLDEVSAFAAGHRPCFECRRKDATAFASAWFKSHDKPEIGLADAIDKQLHAERVQPKNSIKKEALKNLPNGAMIKVNGTCVAKKDDRFLEWTGFGYQATALQDGDVELLTPPSILKTFQNGYAPHWHESAY